MNNYEPPNIRLYVHHDGPVETRIGPNGQTGHFYGLGCLSMQIPYVGITTPISAIGFLGSTPEEVWAKVKAYAKERERPTGYM